MRSLPILLLTALCAAAARAEVVTKAVEYRDGNTVLEGTLVADAAGGKRPGVLIAHEEGGTGALARQRALQCARPGYVVFALDLYGKGVRPRDAQEAAARAGLQQKDRKALRARAEAGLGVLRRQAQVDPHRLAAVGYGVGGTAVLELARAGAELEGVVCVHGDLRTPAPADAKDIRASVLVLLGAEDPLIPPAQVEAFEQEMRKGEVDWQVTRYGEAVHGFTNPYAGRDRSRGTAYDAAADRRAAEAIRSFLADVFPARPAKSEPARAAGVPAKVEKVLKYVDEQGAPLPGYEGGRSFLNVEKHLPQTDGRGQRIKYQEWDVEPLKPGVNRGPERLVTGSDGSAYYTADHYRSFKKIR
jgi:dienelactone hydrolase